MTIGKVDSLSKRPDWEVKVEKDNEDKTLVKPEWCQRTELQGEKEQSNR